MWGLKPTQRVMVRRVRSTFIEADRNPLTVVAVLPDRTLLVCDETGKQAGFVRERDVISVLPGIGMIPGALLEQFAHLLL